MQQHQLETIGAPPPDAITAIARSTAMSFNATLLELPAESRKVAKDSVRWAYARDRYAKLSHEEKQVTISKKADLLRSKRVADAMRGNTLSASAESLRHILSGPPQRNVVVGLAGDAGVIQAPTADPAG